MTSLEDRISDSEIVLFLARSRLRHCYVVLGTVRVREKTLNLENELRNWRIALIALICYDNKQVVIFIKQTRRQS